MGYARCEPLAADGQGARGRRGGGRDASVQVFVEDWAASYGSPYLATPDEAQTAAAVIVEDGGELRAHPGAGAPAASIAFVDGVRRLEATLYLADGADLARGLAGSHACGAAVARAGQRMRVEEVRVTRMAIFGSGLRAQLPDAEGFSWQAGSVASPEPDAPLNDLQQRMRQREGQLAEELAAAGHLVVVDGPLSFVRSRDLPVVGHVKTHYRMLLPADDHRNVPRLAAGERTSLFALGADRYSCYLRLAPPPSSAGPWSGIVRLEIPQSAGLAEAARTADAVAATIPRYAGIPWRDPRAPQNLQPVGALERELRHRLGDARLADRAVRAAVASMTTAPEEAA